MSANVIPIPTLPDFLWYTLFPLSSHISNDLFAFTKASAATPAAVPIDADNSGNSTNCIVDIEPSTAVICPSIPVIDASIPVIMDWAKELKLDKVYTADEIPWFGLFVA